MQHIPNFRYIALILLTFIYPWIKNVDKAP